MRTWQDLPLSIRSIVPRDADGVTELCSRSTGDVEPEYTQSVLVVIDPFGRKEFQDSITHWRLNAISEIS